MRSKNYYHAVYGFRSPVYFAASTSLPLPHLFSYIYALKSALRLRHTVIGRTSAIEDIGIHKRRPGVHLVAESHEGITLGVVLGPDHFGSEPGLGVFDEARPRAHHVLARPDFLLGVGQTRDVLGAAEDHVQVAAVVGAAARVELDVGPGGEVAVAPHGDVAVGAGGGFGAGGAGEAFEVEEGPLRVGQGDVCARGRDVVEAIFFVGVAGQVGLGRAEGV